MQEDTYRGDGLNLYAYCANNPIGYYDPSGHTGQEEYPHTLNDPGETPRRSIYFEGDTGSTELKEIYNSIKESSNYPEGFQAVTNGTTINKINNQQLLEKLREIESGTWKKVYKDGYDAFGNKISIHYFQSQSGKVFDVKVKKGWSN